MQWASLVKNIRSTFGSIFGLADEILRAMHLCSDLRSFFRLSCDLVLYRAWRFIPKTYYNRERSIQMSGGTNIVYRFNKGDIWSLREVWLYECYTPRIINMPVDTFLDLGANIGLTSLWFGRRYQPKTVIAVEPEISNCDLFEKNLSRNLIPHEIIKAAVGCADGFVSFASHQESNKGSANFSMVGSTRMISVNSIMEMFNIDRFDLVKIDIEGGEEMLFSGNLEWLTKVKAIIIEFHPTLVDYPGLVDLLKAQNFTYIAANSGPPGNMDFFVRSEVLSLVRTS